MELDGDTDDPDVEVELDSLGSLFMHLVNNDLPQEEAEASQAEDVEVITFPLVQALCQHKKLAKQSGK